MSPHTSYYDFNVKLILVLQVINLKKVLKGILDYYSEVLGQQIHDFHMPDVSAIGRNDFGATMLLRGDVRTQ